MTDWFKSYRGKVFGLTIRGRQKRKLTVEDVQLPVAQREDVEGDYILQSTEMHNNVITTCRRIPLLLKNEITGEQIKAYLFVGKLSIGSDEIDRSPLRGYVVIDGLWTTKY